MALTITQVRNADSRDKDYKLTDEKGLYLFVTTKGAKSWRMKYRFGNRPDGKPGKVERRLVFGQFPEVTLAEARDRRDLARKLLRENRDPAAELERERASAHATKIGGTFKEVALAWHEDQKPRWSPGMQYRILKRLENDIFPELGGRAIDTIKGPEILVELRKIEARGSIETAKRVRGYVHAVFERARGEHLIDEDVKNPADVISKALKPKRKGAKQPAITDVADLIKLQQVVDRSNSTPIVKLGSRLLALTSLRIGVLRTGEWSEVEGIDWSDPDGDASKAIWRIAAERMKLEVEEKGDDAYDHDVPLVPEAVEVLRALHRLTGRCRYMFPNMRSTSVPMTDSAISTLYKRKGYRNRHVPHGWRSSFSTIMNERAVELERDTHADRQAIDLMLAHVPKGISASEYAYNRAKFAKLRRELAANWAALITKDLVPPMALIDGQER